MHGKDGRNHRMVMGEVGEIVRKQVGYEAVGGGNDRSGTPTS